MTLTRILLRLEVKNDSKILDFSYTAPDLEQEFQKFEVILQKGKRNRSYSTHKSIDLTSQKEIDTLLGQRKYKTYTIETYSHDMTTSEEIKKKTVIQKENKFVSENELQNIKKKKEDTKKDDNLDENKKTTKMEKEVITKSNDSDRTAKTADRGEETQQNKERNNKLALKMRDDEQKEGLKNDKEESKIVSSIASKNNKPHKGTKKDNQKVADPSDKEGAITPQPTAQIATTEVPSKLSFKAVLMGSNNEVSNFNKADPPYNNLPPKNIRFFSGNPAVESAEGVLHLYKESQVHSDSLPPSHMVSMICIPATVCLQDLLEFLKPVSMDMELIRIVKSTAPNEYMALLKFRSMDQAHVFYKAFNSKAFNSLEPDICHLVFVAHIECAKSEEGAGKSFSNAVELPVCAVCLEKMDESVEGILTIMCNHSFHAPCMAQCEDCVCPVCRYIQTPVPVAGNTCFQCSIHEDLWICLICGEVGCGRYTNAHAYNHFKDTAHTFAMQLGSNRVWDYVGENYVHRLVMNKMDGKPVEVGRGGWVDGGARMMQEEKFESLSLEYTYLLTKQLESQREYFEDKIQMVESTKEKELEDLSIRLKEMAVTCVSNKHAVVSSTKEKHVLDKRCHLLSTKLGKMQSSLAEEQEMNSSLRQNQKEWQVKVNELEDRLNAKENESVELRDQLRDIMFYLEAQNKLASGHSDVTAEELQDSHVVLPPQQPTSTRGGKKTGRRKK